MTADGPFAPRRFILPAFSLVWLVALFASLFHAPVYVPEARIQWRAWTAVIASPDPELARQGVEPGTAVDVAHMPFASTVRLKGGAPYGTSMSIAIADAAGTRVVSAPANRQRSIRYVDSTSSFEIWIDLVTMTLSLILAGYLGYRKPSVMVLALMLFIAGGGITWPSVAQALSASPDWIFTPVVWTLSVLCGVFPVLVLASFAIRLPGDKPLPEKRKIIAIIDGIVVLGFALAPFANSNIGSRTYAVASAAVVIAASVLSLRYARPVDRARVAVVFTAVMIGGVGYAIAMIALTFVGGTPFFFYASDVAVLIVPIALAYAILRHRVFDVVFVLNRTIVYALTSAFLIVLLAALEFGAERYIDTTTRAEGIALQFLIALAVTVSAGFAHRRIDQAVDRVLFRTRHQQEEALRRFATTAQFYTAEEPLIRDTVDALARFGRVEGAAVYLATAREMRCAASAFRDAAASVDENDPGYVALRAHRDELDTHDVKTAFPGERLYPMVLAGRLAGALATGRRENGEAMPPDIDEAIRRIAAAVAIALAAIESDRIREENTSLRQRLGVQAV
ncbi:MAG TPA: hypothetical protein VFE36_04015 [Candidatus Baltobacteraceae bacterium]|nr:hypothetical protein [Candidatus Baltobacteraceae bacterium]